MKTSVLLDTNIFLWWLEDDKKLKSEVRKIIENPQSLVFVSVVSAWEMSIKHALGKLPLKTTLQECFRKAGFEVLDIALDYIFELENLPLYHNDPFDRMLIVQARVENLTLITSDQKIWKYDVKVLKC